MARHIFPDGLPLGDFWRFAVRTASARPRLAASSHASTCLMLGVISGRGIG